MASLIIIGPASTFDQDFGTLIEENTDWLCRTFGLPAGYFDQMPVITREVIAESTPKQEPHED